jgi:[acyl-carrier-protein] S-malonyltransferase
VATVIAVVAGRPIDLAALEQRMADVRRGPRGRHLPPENAGPESTRLGRWLVQELVTEAVLEHEVRAAGLSALSPQTLSALVERVTADVTVAAADVRAYYERNPDLYARREVRFVRHAVVAERQAAEAIARDGVADGEELEVHRGELAGDLEEALFRARPGDVVGPIRTEHGWHVARIEAIMPSAITPFEDVRAAISEELLAAARARAFGGWLETRRNALAVIEPAYAHPGDPVHGLPSHRH